MTLNWSLVLNLVTRTSVITPTASSYERVAECCLSECVSEIIHQIHYYHKA